MARRVLTGFALTLAVLAGLALAVSLAAAIALNTERVRAFALRAASAVVEQRTGLRVAVTHTDGAWPFHIILTDVTVADAAAATPVFDAEQIELRWRPWGLLLGQYDFALVEVTRPRLARLPALPARDEPPPAPAARETFPLPPVTVETLRVTEGVLAPAVLPGGAAVSLEGGLIRRAGLQPRITLVAQADIELEALEASPLAAWHGRDAHVELAADVTPKRLHVHLATVTLRHGGFEMRSATATPDGRAQGRISVGARVPDTLTRPLAALAPGDRFSAEARVFLRPGGVAASDITLSSDRIGPLARGDLEASLTGAALDARATLAAPPGALHLIDPSWTMAGDTAVSLTLTGAPSAFRTTVAVTAPPARIAGLTTPGLTATARLSDLPRALDARIAVHPRPRANAARTPPPRPSDDRARATVPGAARDGVVAHITSPDWSAFELVSARARVAGATATAEGRLTRAPVAGEVAAAVRVPDIAALLSETPAPDLALTGDVTADLAIALDDRPRLELTAQSTQLATDAVAVRGLDATARGPLDALEISLAADGLGASGADPIATNIAATQRVAIRRGAQGVTLEALVRALGGVVLDTDMALAAPTLIAVAPGRLSIAAADLMIGAAGRARVSADLSPETQRASMEMEAVAIPALNATLDGTISLDTASPAAASDAAPSHARPSLGRMDVRLSARPPGRPPARLLVRGVWDGVAADLRADLEGLEEGSPLQRSPVARARLPARLTHGGPEAGLDLAGDADIALDYDGPIAPLFSLVGSPDQHVTGRLRADARLTGPYDALVAAGGLTWSDGAYTHDQLALTVGAVNARLTASGPVEAAALELEARADNGRARDADTPAWRATGALRPQTEGPPRVDIALALDRAWVVRRDDVSARVSGAARLTGTPRDLRLAGDVRVDALDAAIPEPSAGAQNLETVRVVRVDVPPADTGPETSSDTSSKPSTGALRPQRPAGGPPVRLALDLSVTADDRVVVRGRGLESAWSADVRVLGTANAPRFAGEVAVARGGLDFAGRRLDLTRGVITFTGDVDPDPVLSIDAETTALTGERLMVRITGRASDPSITLSSTPALPEEDVLALLLFGRPVTELSAFESVRLAQAAAALSGAGPFGGPSVLDRARRSLGLDLLRVTQSETGEAGLSVGKYVTDRVLVTANQDVTGEAGSIAIAVRLTDALSLQTDVGQDSSGSVGLSWRLDY